MLLCTSKVLNCINIYSYKHIKESPYDFLKDKFESHFKHLEENEIIGALRTNPLSLLRNRKWKTALLYDYLQPQTPLDSEEWICLKQSIWKAFKQRSSKIYLSRIQGGLHLNKGVGERTQGRP